MKPDAPYAIMGILNVTPDSFSDGGTYEETGAAVAQAARMAAEGASIVDVGGESTRPGAGPVPAEAELRRVLPVVDGIGALGLDVQISVDTTKLEVAEAAVAAGATYVNDVTAFRHDPEMASLVADRGLDCCLMHMLGEPRTMQDEPRYDDVVDDVRAFLEERLAAAVAEGVPEERVAARPRDRVRQDRRAQPRAAAAPRRAARDRAAARDRHVAQDASSAGSPAARSPSGSTRRSPPTSSPTSGGRACSASTTSRRPRMRWP